jgi:hypothetical protein
MFLRFVVPALHRESSRRTGVFQEVYRLMRAGELLPHEEQRAQETLDWFNESLAEPDRFARSPRSGAAALAISWFKDSATEHVSRMYELASILDAHGIAVEVIRTERPGYVVFEDEHQIVAEPFSETPT